MGMEKISKIEGYLVYLMNGLQAIDPMPECVLFRGISRSKFQMVQEHYTTGRTIHWSGLSSVSRDERVSNGFAKEDGPGGVVFHITVKTGRSISHLSAFPNEDEVLLLPNFKGFVSEGMKPDG